MVDEIEALHTELDHYRDQREKIRDVIGKIGGQTNRTRDMVINVIFLVAVGGFFTVDIVRHILGLEFPFLPSPLLLEIAVLLVSLKIIWMIHRQGKVEHFQFWILNSIEFQMNMISRRLNTVETLLREAGQNQSDESVDKQQEKDVKNHT